VRIRILRAVEGVVDGLSLSHLLPGVTYEIESSVARWLVDQGSAEEIPAHKVALATTFEDLGDFSQMAGGVSVTPPRSLAADTPPKSKKRTKR
jgi:hypothetical protein